MRFNIFLTALATVMIAGTASAEGVPIDPGMWRMTTTMTMTMIPQPHTTTVNECIEDDELSPESFNLDKESPCKISDVVVDGNTARWSISCATEGGPMMEGQWEFTSSGDTISGNGTMSTEMNGQTMGFEMEWTGARTGVCE